MSCCSFRVDGTIQNCVLDIGPLSNSEAVKLERSQPDEAEAGLAQEELQVKSEDLWQSPPSPAKSMDP